MSGSTRSRAGSFGKSECGSSPGETGVLVKRRPRSSKQTLCPACVSRHAATAPPKPEPITMASKGSTVLPTWPTKKRRRSYVVAGIVDAGILCQVCNMLDFLCWLSPRQRRDSRPLAHIRDADVLRRVAGSLSTIRRSFRRSSEGAAIAFYFQISCRQDVASPGPASHFWPRCDHASPGLDPEKPSSSALTRFGHAWPDACE